MNIYIAGPMQGIKDFNFPEFNRVAALFEGDGHTVFNPAQRDIKAHGQVFHSPTGSLGDIPPEAQFSLRQALADDTQWICLHADSVAMLPGWEYSKGARVEHALAVALGLEILYPSSQYY